MRRPYGPIGPSKVRKAGKKVKVHVNLDPAITELLDVIALKMGDDPLYPTPSRSDLLNKAALLYIARCKERLDLKDAIQSAEQKAAAVPKLIALSDTEQQSRKGRSRSNPDDQASSSRS